MYLDNFICTRIRVRLISEKKFWVENWNSGGENTSFGVDFFPLADFPSLHCTIYGEIEWHLNKNYWNWNWSKWMERESKK